MTNEEILWNYFIADDKIGNPFGVAGLLGNIKAESSFSPKNLSNAGNKKTGMTDDEYTEAVDTGVYDRFVNDGCDYGLCQWIFWSRKKKLLTYAQQCKKSVGDLALQMDFIWVELNEYTSVLRALRNAKSVEEASDVVMVKYEKPADQSEAAKEKRRKYARDIYNRNFEKIGDEKMTEGKNFVAITGDLVNVRMGDSKEYRAWGQVKKGATFELVAVSVETGWYAVRVGDKQLILWVSPKYAEIVGEGTKEEAKV